MWNNRRPKIPIEILKKAKYEGGAGLVDFKMKDLALKASWVQTLQSDTYLQAFANRKLCGVLKNHIWQVNISAKDVKKCFNAGFWCDVLYAWALYNYDQEIEPRDCINQIIWYNTAIRCEGKPFIFAEPAKEGLLYISQLIDIEGGFMPHEIMKCMFNITYMQYNTILSAMPKEWKEIIKAQGNLDVAISNNNYDKFLIKQRVTSIVYKEINQSVLPMRVAYKKWAINCVFYDFDDFCNLFYDLYTVTTNTKLRSFQFRILHKAIVLNSHLARWKIRNSNLCSMCNTAKEDIIHFFCECPEAVRIWNSIRKYAQEIAQEEFSISKYAIIANKVNPKGSHIFNFLALVTKHYLYVCRCLGVKPSTQQIILKIKSTKVTNYIMRKKKTR